MRLLDRLTMIHENGKLITTAFSASASIIHPQLPVQFVPRQSRKPQVARVLWLSGETVRKTLQHTHISTRIVLLNRETTRTRHFSLYFIP